MFLGSRHWLCAFCIGGVVNIADSLGLFMSFNQHTILQLAKLYHFEDASELKLLKMGVQQQIGLVDCGVFAIAYAVELCHGANPEKVIFLQKQMRQHLYDCFQNQKLTTPFPKGEDTDDTLPRPQRNLFTIKLYCTCRMPDIYDEKMINCDQCQKWYHFHCVDMNELAPPPTQWLCNDCI